MKTKFLIILIIVIFALAVLVFSFLLPAFWQKDVYLGNFHTHTTCSDGQNTYDEMVEEAVRLGFKFLAITDHIVCEETFKKCQNEKRILCIPGQEITTPNGHILALDLKEAIPQFLFSPEIGTEVWQDILKKGLGIEIPLEEAVESIHNQAGLAIAAHPMQGSIGIEKSELGKINFDAMECDHPSYSLFQAHKAGATSEEFNIPCVFNSDAHQKQALKSMYNICQLKELSRDGIKQAIKDGKCKKYEPLLVKISRILNLSYFGIRIYK
ncbi:MAG: PHP domain-containing protein [Patescibacteria group bacterium]